PLPGRHDPDAARRRRRQGPGPAALAAQLPRDRDAARALAALTAPLGSRAETAARLPSSGSLPLQLEAAERAAAEGRGAPVAVAVSLEHVDEAAERRPVDEPEPVDPERDAGEPPDAGLATLTVDPLGDADARRQQAAAPAHGPDTVELPHATTVPRDARSKRPLPADGGGARRRAAGRRRLAVRAEVGRLPRRARERRRRARALEPERPAAPPVLPGAAAARRAAAAALGARRRDRDRAGGAARLRRDADAPAPGREPHPQALGRDPGAARRLRPPALGRGGRARAAAGGAARRARARR